ncbi:MAG: helicase HerA domain-containing protein, partial [Candidatus Nezhaarchaeales archaeon]
MSRIPLGNILDEHKKPRDIFYLNVDALRRHVCIVGSSGSDKSTTAKIIAYELVKRGVPVLILDRHYEYSRSLPCLINDCDVLTPGVDLHMAFFEPKRGVDIEEQIDDWVNLIDHYLQTTYLTQLTPLQSRLLRENLAKHYRKE